MSEPSQNTIKNTILIVDDSPDTQILLKKFLGSKGYNVITASTSSEGLKKFLDHQDIRLVLLDINLNEDTNGIHLAKKFSEFRPDRTFSMSFLSGIKVDTTFVEAAKKIGVDDFIPKPVNLGRLISKVEDLLGALPENLDISQKLKCEFSCNLVNVNILPILKIIQITPASFLLKSSADFSLGTIIHLHCPSLQAILSEKYFTLKVLRTKYAKSTFIGELPFVVRCQIIEMSSQFREILASLFKEDTQLPHGLEISSSTSIKNSEVV